LEINEHLLAEEGWRLRLDRYAERVSRGKFVRYAWASYLMRRVQDELAKGNARIAIGAPPRHGKSLSMSKWLPTWYLDWFPEDRVIFSSYGQAFAKKWGLAVRDNFEQNPLTMTRIRSDKRLADNWQTTKGGGMLCAGVDGTVTGEGFDLGIIDDPHKNWEEAMSATQRQHVIDWFLATYYTRSEPNSSIIVCQTRWHERDLIGYLTSEEHDEDWTYIRLPALAEAEDLLGRAPGEALCPERFTAERLEKIKRVLGTAIFTGLYQQRPSPPEGNQVKRAWFQRYLRAPEAFDQIIQSWDLAFTETGSSYSVCQIWGQKGPDVYFLDTWRDKVDFPTSLRRIKTMSERWPTANVKVFENKANGPAVISTLRQSTTDVHEYNPKGSKEVRLAAVTGMIEGGNVYIPDDSIAPWIKDFVDEVVMFPKGENDDQVDAFSQALDYLRQNQYNTNIVLPDAGVRSSPWGFANVG
jgi:predicted phage terminase large subunit-like protein